MHPKYVLPLFPTPNSARVSFEIFGELFAGNDKGFGIDATAQNVHGCCGVGAAWFELSILESPLPSPLLTKAPVTKGREQENFDSPENKSFSFLFPP